MTRADPQPVYRPHTAADELGARLRTRLLEGGFTPGETISIRRVAEAEGVSVIPARDALRGLVAEGALEFRDARTIAVPAPDPATLGQLRYARLSVEGELAHRAWPCLVKRTAELEEIDAGVTRALLDRDVAAYMRTNRALHFAIYERAKAPILFALAERLWLLYAPGMRIVCEAFDGQLPGSDHHVEAIAALRAGDRAAFRAAVEADIAQGMDTLLEHVRTTAPNAQERGDP
ncbi:GntR family transcriptional regulator [Ovoidimarina sediminis]|uniref:GntR family transcriptional regulator n=1 Tax=Ovoidimarina sediminis TaxID=3079856 RepID=UPI0029073128|nr:GntR family transcriptional regulator [Rhodophyticola sp. MJ-SS7]MDU8943665.1 GntR family transcriptional regulator [Rhodophyticola sp. MJ-SS7]